MFIDVYKFICMLVYLDKKTSYIVERNETEGIVDRIYYRYN
jgi:hypothetical protein